MSDCIPHLNGNPTTYEAIKSQLLNDRDLLAKYVQGAKTGVPDAPFVGSTPKWASLAMRRMIRYASEQGYDRISWDSGATQAERYDLSKHVNSIDVIPRTDAASGEKTRAVHIQFRDEGVMNLGVDKNGVIDNAAGPGANQFTGKSLSDVVGKDVAEKIMSSDRQTLSGENLRIGGQGQIGFYDKILPSVANEIGKKWGARVEKVGFPTFDNTRATVEKTSSGYNIRIGGVLEGIGFPNAEEAWAYVEKTAREQPTVKSDSLPITPQMRESVMTQGQALFMPAGEIPGSLKPAGDKFGLIYAGMMGDERRGLHLFTDPKTKSTISVSLDAKSEDLAKKVEESRSRFGGDKIAP